MFPGLAILLCKTFGVCYLHSKGWFKNPAVFSLLCLSLGETDRKQMAKIQFLLCTIMPPWGQAFLNVFDSTKNSESTLGPKDAVLNAAGEMSTTSSVPSGEEAAGFHAQLGSREDPGTL